MTRWIFLLALAACGGGPAGEATCTDTIDDDADGLVDCDDTDCDGDDACIVLPETCTGDADEDRDTFIDCEDDDCWEDPACFAFDDGVDLPDGDPALDLDKLGVTLSGGTAVFFVTTEGAWPPAAGFYSWFVYFEIDNDGFTPVAGVTIQQHAGVDDQIELGIPAANVTVRQTPRGVWVRMTGVPATGETFYVESGIQKTDPGTRVTDTVVSSPAPLP